MAVFEETWEDPIYERRLNNETWLLLKEAARFDREGETEVAYEAGSMGYVIHRAMEQAGIRCYMYKHRNYLTVPPNEGLKLSCRFLLP